MLKKCIKHMFFIVPLSNFIVFKHYYKVKITCIFVWPLPTLYVGSTNTYAALKRRERESNQTPRGRR
jgi:uncharacterized membrane protein